MDSARCRASAQRFARRMLALLSTRTTTRARDRAPALHALTEEIKEGQFQRALGAEAMTRNAQPLTDRPQRGARRLDVSRVILARRSWIDKECATRFHVLKHRRGF